MPARPSRLGLAARLGRTALRHFSPPPPLARAPLRAWRLDAMAFFFKRSVLENARCCDRPYADSSRVGGADDKAQAGMKTILVVDDEPTIRMLVSTTLADANYRIIEAGDAGTALRLAAAHKPELVVLDWMMPGSDGLSVAHALRADPANARLAILMLTAKGQDRDRTRAAAVGVDSYLVKPFSPLELMDRVRALLGDRGSR
jgi:CheY-like chemotaxis protein